MKKTGFTLIEILVVVAIIGLLATMGLVAFQKSLQRSRDARRMSEVKALQNAAEQYYSDHNNSYPTTNVCSNLNNYVQGFNGTYVDPKGIAYQCIFTPTASWDYCISTLLETQEATAGNSSTNCSGVGGASSRYYNVYNLF